MTAPQTPAGPLSPAEAAFVELLGAHERPTPAELEAFCAGHRDVEPELRKLYSEWNDVRRVIDARESGRTFREELVRRVGKDVDPGVSLGEDEADQTPGTEVLRRLGDRGPELMRYQVRGEVARGGMGTILKVWDRDLRRTLAMKVAGIERRIATPQDKPVTDERQLARFLEEAQVTGQLGHPGVVPVHEIGLDPHGRVYFTMPLVRGRDFLQVIPLARESRDGWSMARALGVVLKVCEAVAYAHSKGVIHRDIKPANVRVGDFGQTYVMDWGLARVIGRPDRHDLRLKDDSAQLTTEVHTDRRDLRGQDPSTSLLTMDGDVVGTPSYMPLEQAQGRVDEIGPRSDVYSIGALLYHLLTGQAPYVPHGASLQPRIVLAALLYGTPKPVLEIAPGAPGELAAICEKAMARDPGRRYENALALAQDIEAYLGSRPVTAFEASMAYVLRLFYQRNKLLVRMAGIFLVLLAIFGAFFFYERHRAGLRVRAAERERQRTSEMMAAIALPEQVASLYPALPGSIERMATWLQRVGELLEREDSWCAEIAAGEETGDPQLASLAKSFADLKLLQGKVRASLELARSLADPDHLGRRAAWERAVETIARSPRYGGIRISPVEALVPLDPDPSTALWEFWNPLSGEKPVRDPGTGRLRTSASDGIVLVLLPGGSFEKGSPESEPYREELETLESVDIAPFYAGKYEVTQAQWTRVMGSNPSLFAAGMALRDGGKTMTDLHPVENLTWPQSAEFARRIGLVLPTDTQWEYAARAGTQAPWYCGEDEACLEAHENLGDESAVFTLGEPVPWDDGYPAHAPIGSFAGNRFGLCDMLGNVAEWCSNWQENDWLAPGEPRRKHIRGGHWAATPAICRAAQRQRESLGGSNMGRGLRMALDFEVGKR